jgi:hypothetical protein
MTAAPLLKRALLYGTALTLAIAVLGSIVGLIVAGIPGLVGALIGAGLTAVFLGLTSLSILLGFKASRGELLNPVFFATVMGGWLLKLLLFLALIFILGEQDFYDRTVMFGTIVAAVIGSLISDVVAMARSRMPYVSDVKLPGE